MLEVGDRFPVEKLPVQLDGPAVVYFYRGRPHAGLHDGGEGFNDRYDSASATRATR